MQAEAAGRALRGRARRAQLCGMQCAAQPGAQRILAWFERAASRSLSGNQSVICDARGGPPRAALRHSCAPRRRGQGRAPAVRAAQRCVYPGGGGQARSAPAVVGGRNFVASARSHRSRPVRACIPACISSGQPRSRWWALAARCRQVRCRACLAVRSDLPCACRTLCLQHCSTHAPHRIKECLRVSSGHTSARLGKGVTVRAAVSSKQPLSRGHCAPAPLSRSD